MGLAYSSAVSAAVDDVFSWHARPGGFDPPNSFADSLTTPLLAWRHTHQFSPAGDRATLVTDVVDTPLPARVLRSMFAYRHRQLAADLAALARARSIYAGPLTVAVTGSGGLIGTALTALLTTSGHQVIRLVRRRPCHAHERYWRPEAGSPRNARTRSGPAGSSPPGAWPSWQRYADYVARTSGFIPLPPRRRAAGAATRERA